jgi:hypothetical protein
MRAPTHLLFLLVALLAGTTAPSAAADSKIDPATETCIRDNVLKVERAIDDLGQATTFLTTNICAVPVAAETARRQRQYTEAYNAQWAKMCDEQKATTKTKKKDELSFDPCTISATTKIGFLNIAGADEEELSSTIYTSGIASPAATALAAQLLLDLRLSHQKNRQ